VTLFDISYQLSIVTISLSRRAYRFGDISTTYSARDHQ